MKLLPILLLASASALAQDISLRPVATGLDTPVAATHAGDSRLFITLQHGQIVIHDGTQVRATPFLDIRSLVLCCGERGLLSVAFHPQYKTNGYFFVYYTDLNGDIVIARYKVSTDPNVADPNSGAILLTIAHRTFSNHNGGQLAFGPDGFLYAGTGDGGGGGDPLHNGQNLQALLGKILRIDVDNGPPYGIPPLNPFAGRTDARNEIWAYGLRNPWRFSFDRENGDLLVADVGQNLWEEIDYQLSTSPGGENYGWPVMEGRHCYNATTCSQSGLVLPILEYGHTGGACSVTGGYRYRGSRSSRLRGLYFFADYCNGLIWGATRNADATWTTAQLYDAAFSISAFGEGVDKELYVVDHGGSVLLIEDPLAPSITSIAPASGRSTGGESVTITGANLSNATSVSFGGAAGAITNSNSTSITVLTPGAPSIGLVDVVVTTPAGSATLPSGFRYDLGAPASVIAGTGNSTNVNIFWTPVNGATSYEVARSANGTSYTTVQTTTGTSLTDVTVAMNTSYLYKVRAVRNGTFGPYSGTDLATTVAFTDDPLNAGTTIKRVHLTQLRTAVNAVRTLAGIGTATFTDPSPTVIRAAHITELRARLNEARGALGLAALVYTDPTITARLTRVRAVHVRELRDGVR